MQMADKAVSVEGGEENNNDIKIREPPVSFRSGVWKHFGFQVNVHDGKEVEEKENFVITTLVSNQETQVMCSSCHVVTL